MKTQRQVRPVILLSGILLFQLVLFWPLQLLAQQYLDPDKIPDQYNFQRWTNEDGLPDNAVIKIIQSKDGYIWFCSYGGITRFNGSEFYTYSSYNSPEIVNNSFTSIFEDKDGTIWAATSGNGAVTINNGQVKGHTKKDGLPSNFIEGFAQGLDGRLWVATSEGLAYRQGDRFVNDGLPESLKTMNIVYLDIDENNHLWLATYSEGLFEYHDGKILRNINRDNGLPGNRVNYLNCEDGNVYVGVRGGMVILEEDQTKLYTLKDGLQDEMIISIEKSENGWLWVGSYKGFCRVKDDKFEYFSEKHPIYGRDITSILEDAEGNLWVSTYRSGLFRFWEGKFKNYRDFSLESERPYTVHSIIEKSANEFILVSEDQIDIVDPTRNSIKPYNEKSYAQLDKLKTGILDSQGRLWVGGRNGLMVDNNGSSKIYDENNGLIFDNVRVLLEDSKQRIWVGTFLGITVLDLPNNTQFNVTTETGLSHDYIMGMMEDKLGRIWISTRSGVNIYEDGSVKKFDTSDGLAGDFAFKTFQDTEGVVWVLGNAGLSRFKDGKFQSITTKDGLISNTLFQAIEDNQGNFWFTTNQKGVSLFKVKKTELHDKCDGKIDRVNSIIYDRSDGIMASAATSSSTSIKDSTGKLWFATQFGAEIIDPNQILTNELEPPVHIEHVRVNDVDYNLNERVVVPHGKNRIDIGFSCLSYRFPTENQYRYMLEGYDSDWINPKGELETSYTNLPHGKYTFKVIAANNDGVWNEKGASIDIVIEAPFYLTVWFILIAIVFFFLVVYAIYYWRISALKRAQIELEKAVADRTAEVVLKKEEIETQKEEIEAQRKQIEKQHEELKDVNKNLEGIVDERTKELKSTYRELLDVNKELDTFIYRAVHDIRGPIARLQGLSQLIQLETEDANILNLVGMLNTTADDMNDVFYRLINIVRLKTSDISLYEVKVREAIDSVMEHFEVPGLKDEYELRLDISKDLSLTSNQETIEIILHQLVDNAIKFRKRGQKARIIIKAYRHNKKYINIEVTDFGQGIYEGNEEKIFDMFYIGSDTENGAGLGLYTVRTAVKVLKSEIRVTRNASKDEATTFELSLLDQKE